MGVTKAPVCLLLLAFTSPSNLCSNTGSQHPLSTMLPHKADRAQIRKELLSLPLLIQERFVLWRTGAKPFQLEAMEAQILGVDVLLHAATGAGKTGIAAGPHLLPSSKGKITIMISPLLALQDEQACGGSVETHASFLTTGIRL